VACRRSVEVTTLSVSAVVARVKPEKGPTCCGY
jgi:hypothetical protein